MKKIKQYWVVLAIIVVISAALYLDAGLRKKQSEIEAKLVKLNSLKGN